eukprot:5408940-Amphidinium_carterae.1
MDASMDRLVAGCIPSRNLEADFATFAVARNTQHRAANDRRKVLPRKGRKALVATVVDLLPVMVELGKGNLLGNQVAKVREVRETVDQKGCWR